VKLEVPDRLVPLMASIAALLVVVYVMYLIYDQLVRLFQGLRFPL